MESSLRLLTKDHQVIILEAPGYGKTNIIPANVSLEKIAENISITINILGLEKIHLMASSFGALFAGYICKSKAIFVEKSILTGFGPLCSQVVNSLYQCINLIEDKKYHDLTNLFSSLILNYQARDHIKLFTRVEENFKHYLMNLEDVDYEKFNENIKRVINANKTQVPLPNCLTLIYTGEYDSFTPVHMIKNIANKKDNFIVTTIKNSDHLCHVQERKEVAYVTNTFLNSHK